MFYKNYPTLLIHPELLYLPVLWLLMDLIVLLKQKNINNYQTTYFLIWLAN